MLLAVSLAFALTPAVRPTPLVIVSWDGGADWVIDRLLKEGKLPNVGKMDHEGMSAERVIPAFPSKTAVSHFSIFSGTWHNRSAVSGNSSPLLPRSEHSLLEQQSGFDGSQHRTEPLWVTFAKGGLNVVALSAAGSYPPSPDVARLKAANVPLSRYREFSGFESGFSGSQVYTKPIVSGERGLILSFKVGTQSFQAHPFDDPKDPVVGYDTVRLTQVMPEPQPEGHSTNRVYLLKPLEADGKRLGFTEPIRIRSLDDRSSQTPIGTTSFRLFSLEPKTGEMCLYRRAAAFIKGTESVEENNAYIEAYGGFHDDPFGVYEDGGFGKAIPDGGDGTAERRVLECVRQDMVYLKRSFRYAMKNYRPEVVFHYSPQSDGAGHCWMGILDPTLPGYDPKLAAKILPFYEQVFQAQDDWLGDMMSAAGPKAAFALVSDHGMAGVRNSFFTNRVLEQAGLCAYTPDGTIDLSKTKACSPPWGDFMVVANTTDRKGGIVPPAQREAVLRAAAAALKEARDPNTGEKVVTRVIWPNEARDLGLGGEGGGDFYLDFLPGYYPRASKGDETIRPNLSVLGNGSHGWWPKRRTMNSIFYLWGAGVPHKPLGTAYAVDIAPTLCRLMGVTPSPDTQGHPK